MNKRNYFGVKTFKVNKSKSPRKPRTHKEYIARMREPLVIFKTERVKDKCEYLDFKNDRCKSDAEFIILRKSKGVKLCRSHCKYTDKVMERISSRGGTRVADGLPNDNPKTVKIKTDISKVVEDRSDYFLSESELAEIKAKILGNENE